MRAQGPAAALGTAFTYQGRLGDGGSPATIQWRNPPSDASGSLTTIASSTVPAGTPVHCSGGDTFSPPHAAYCAGKNPQVSSIDLVEVNPTLDIRNATAEFGTELVLSALGKRIL